MRSLATLVVLGAAATVCQSSVSAQAARRAPGIRFEITFPASLHAGPLTGRMFVAVSRKAGEEPRMAGYNSARHRDGEVPLFAADVAAVPPGRPAVVDGSAEGYPYPTLGDLPAGDYYVQAIVNVYTEFHRADGHLVWAHNDQWEGQRWGFSPGNLYSEPQRVHLDPAAGTVVRLELTKVIPPIQLPADTRLVKHIKIQSKLLSAFWGQPMYLGATVLLPRGYDEHPNVRYPVIYEQGHFSLEPAFGYTTTPPSGGPGLFADMIREAGSRSETGYQFSQEWDSDSMPRMVAITFQHPTPYFDDSYAVNSANNGPYGDAILMELIPYLEQHFRIVAQPYARVLTGGSTGGWESLALQVYHPDFFGGTWTFFPDPVDFRQYQLVNIYEDTSAFTVPNAVYGQPERPFQMNVKGQTVATNRMMSRLEHLAGTHGRSAWQIDAWNAAYGPVGVDGYPREVWDKKTGMIDREVAYYMRDHGYDLRYYLEQNWPKIGPSLVGKIRLYCGDMDHFFLAFAVYRLEEFLESTKAPYYAGHFEYGRPMKGHGWHPITNAELVQMMAAEITRNAPAGEDTKGWRY
ncbi:MAG: hypothetical protein HY700_07310 [Gemmatimonadetes bacterium]|nr:hypothetical protein [Gemmatimonadota bacterium]